MPVIYWERISRNTVRTQRKDKEALTKGRFTGRLLGVPLCWGLCLETGSHCVTLTALKFNNRDLADLELTGDHVPLPSRC